jgi:hypothetical protein
MALNLLFADVIRYHFENKNETTLIVHPRFQDGLFDDIDIPLGFASFPDDYLEIKFFATSWYNDLGEYVGKLYKGCESYRINFILEFQNYLCNSQRSGDNFIHGRMYALVPVQIIKLIKSM